MGEARCEAVCPGIFLPVLMIGGKCFCLRAKATHISGQLPIAPRAKKAFHSFLLMSLNAESAQGPQKNVEHSRYFPRVHPPASSITLVPLDQRWASARDEDGGGGVLRRFLLLRPRPYRSGRDRATAVERFRSSFVCGVRAHSPGFASRAATHGD